MELFIPLSVTMGVIVWSLAATWWALDPLRRLPREQALLPLILPHGLRYIGLAFLVPGVTATPLPSVFAGPAAYGDLAAAGLAVLAALALRGGWPGALALVWVFNLFGAADLIYALARGMQNLEPHMPGATYFIPALLVPPLLVGHGLVFWRLRRP
jgi:hypothetical protein